VDELTELEAFAGVVGKITPKSFTKYQALLKLLRDSEYGWKPDDPADRLVIFTERIETLEFIAKNIANDLKLPEDAVVKLHGGSDLSDMEVQEIVEDFGKETSPVRVLVASDMGSEGINLHYLCHRLIHFDIPWSLIIFQQRNGRIDRYGQKKVPLITYLKTEFTAPRGKGDLRLLEILIEKDQHVHMNIGDPYEFIGTLDVEEDEERTGQAIEEGQPGSNVRKRTVSSRISSKGARETLPHRLKTNQPCHRSSSPITNITVPVSGVWTRTTTSRWKRTKPQKQSCFPGLPDLSRQNGFFLGKPCRSKAAMYLPQTALRSWLRWSDAGKRIRPGRVGIFFGISTLSANG
jgi:superfamily II DNA/RNA helicase